jgi:hypothetical protein
MVNGCIGRNREKPTNVFKNWYLVSYFIITGIILLLAFYFKEKKNKTNKSPLIIFQLNLVKKNEFIPLYTIDPTFSLLI